MSTHKFCATCNPDLMPDTKSNHKEKKQNTSWLSFDRMLPMLLGVLVIVSTVQTVELSNLKDSLSSNAQVVSTASAAAPTAQPTTQPANPYQGLPSQVGGC